VRVPNRRVLLLAALRGLALVVVLLTPWPGLGRTFGAVFAATADLVLHCTSVGGVALDIETPRAAGLTLPPWLVVLTLTNVKTGVATRSALNARALAYVPLAIFAAMAGAVPPRRGMRTLTAAVGVALLGAYLSLGIGATLALQLAGPRVQALSLGTFGQRIVEAVFLASAETSVAAPALLWLLTLYVVGMVPERWRATAERPERPAASAARSARSARGKTRGRTT
jgi:hypothetical protein